MTGITCTIHGNSTVTPKFLDCPWCVEADCDRFRALADELAEALNQIKKNAESQLVCMNAMKVPDTAPEWVNANWNRTEADAALAKYHAAVKEGD